LSFANAIKDPDQIFIALAEHVSKLDVGCAVTVLQGRDTEEERAAKARLQVIGNFRFLHDRRKLMQVPEQQQPYPAERLPWATAVDAQRLVDRPHQVRPHHRHFIDDEEFEPAHDAAVAAAPDVIGPDQARGKAEKGMDRLSADVDGGEPGRGQHDALAGNDLTQAAQQRRLAGSGAAGDEQVATSRSGKFSRQLVLAGDLNPIRPWETAGWARCGHRVPSPAQATASAPLSRSIFLRMLGSSQRLRKRIDLGVISTSSSSAM